MRDNVIRITESFQDTVLTSAQMDTLNATPVSLVPAPGSGLVNIVTGVYVEVTPGSTPFELGSGVLEVRYTDGSGSKVITDIANAVVESASLAKGWNPPIVCVPVSNAAIVAHTSADVTAGDGSVKFRVFYKTVLSSELA